MKSAANTKVRSLRFWIPMLLASFCLIGGAVDYWIEVQRGRAEFEDEFKEDQVVRANRLQADVERWVQRNDLEMIQSIFAELGVIPELKLALFLNAQNVVLASMHRQDLGGPADFKAMGFNPADRSQLPVMIQKAKETARGITRFTNDRDGLILCFPTYLPLHPGDLEVHRGGMILLSFDLAKGKSARLNRVQRDFLGYFAGVLGVAMLLGFCLDLIITRRLEGLKSAMADFALGKTIQLAPSKGSDEIADLVTHFRRMANTIQTNIQEIQDLYQRYRMVFEHSPVTIWEEDFSEVKVILESIRSCGTTDLAAYFQEHPEVIKKCSEAVKIIDVNRAALGLHGATNKSHLMAGLADTFTPESYEMFQQELLSLWNGRTEITGDSMVKTLQGDSRDVTVFFSVCPGFENDLSKVIVSLSDITTRKRAEGEIRKLNAELEQRVLLRTKELAESQQELQQRAAMLEASNKELESFSYSVSHDLRAPLRSIDGFSKALLEDYGEKLDSEGKEYLQIIRSASQRMAQLIDDILQLSRITRADLRRHCVDLSSIAKAIVEELRHMEPGREVEVVIEPECLASADGNLMRIVLENLLGNAWKFTSKKPKAKIAFGKLNLNEVPTFFVSDNGAGFDMRYASKLFGAFQRLHSMKEFPGTGIGLASVQRIINRHGGKVWIEAKPEEGATAYFTLA